MNALDKIKRLFTSQSNIGNSTNKFNEAFYSLIGQTGTQYDADGKTYVEKGYNLNSVIYSIIQQQARKSADIPHFIKKVKSNPEAKQFRIESKRANIDQPQAKMFLKRLEQKAFESNADLLEMPLEKPNIGQSWGEFIALYKTFLKLNGNAYIYMLMPDEGKNSGVPIAFYLLPSHLMNIVLKPDANMMLDESPVDYYKLIDGTRYVKFKAENVIHVKYSNVNFSLNGEHLYGQSPLRSALRNIESSNEALNQNIKTLKNSGTFGFIHGKSQPITPDQAQELKSRLTEMDDSPERLGRLAGVSAEIGFTRLSLTTDELKPFEYLNYDQKQLCNVLGWSDKLLNSDSGAKYDNVKEFRKQVVTDDILPDLGLLENAFNELVLPKFKNYQNTVLYFDASTLPEMQADMQTLTNWLSTALMDGALTRNEYREALNYPLVEDNADFDRFTTKMGIVPLEDTFLEMPDDETINAGIEDDEKKSLIVKAGFNPNQERDDSGKWGSGSGLSCNSDFEKLDKFSRYDAIGNFTDVRKHAIDRAFKIDINEAKVNGGVTDINILKDFLSNKNIGLKVGKTSNGNFAEYNGSELIFSQAENGAFVMLHELGEVANREVGNKIQISDDITRALTSYGANQGNDAFADAFAYYFLQPEMLKDLEPKVYKELDLIIPSDYKEISNKIKRSSGYSGKVKYTNPCK